MSDKEDMWDISNSNSYIHWNVILAIYSIKANIIAFLPALV